MGSLLFLLSWGVLMGPMVYSMQPLPLCPFKDLVFADT